MQKKETARGGNAKRWRTIRLKDGRTLKVAIVRKAGPKGERTPAGTPRTATNKDGK